MQRKTAIGVVLGVTVVSLISTVGSMSLIGGGGSGGAGPSHRSHILCLIWYLTVNLMIFVEVLVCTFSCNQDDPNDCFHRCVTRYLIQLLAIFTAMFLCITFF